MTTVEYPASVEECIELPLAVSCYKLNTDGTYELGTAPRCSVYIKEDQVNKIWHPEIAKFIREKYGPYVGVMHFTKKDVRPPVYPTFKYVLGG